MKKPTDTAKKLFNPEANWPKPALMLVAVLLGGVALAAPDATNALQPLTTFLNGLSAPAKVILGGILGAWLIYVVFKLVTDSPTGMRLAFWTGGGLFGGLVLIAVVGQIFAGLNFNVGGGN